MADKPQISVTLKASGLNRDGVRVDATVEGPAENFDQLKKKIDNLMYDTNAKPIPEDGEVKEK